MSRFKSRVNRLVVKTHHYTSSEELKIFRDFLKARLDEANVKPEDLQEAADQLDKLYKEQAIQSSEETNEKIRELLEKTPLANTTLLYRFSVKEYQNHPNGIWNPKYLSGRYLDLISKAKNYFKSLKKNIT